MMIKIVSGGQTGVDRAALDLALDLGLDYGGWCPQGGWAEDMANPPGLLKKYPKLLETPSPQPAQRTEWNVRDSSATLILVCGRCKQFSAGTQLTFDLALQWNKSVLKVDIDQDNLLTLLGEWISSFGEDLVLNVAGCRESECPGIYSATKKIMKELIKRRLEKS